MRVGAPPEPASAGSFLPGMIFIPMSGVFRQPFVTTSNSIAAVIFTPRLN
jgi:hypothetical protein